MEAARLLKSSTPAVSPIGTPSKTPAGQRPTDARRTDATVIWSDGMDALCNNVDVSERFRGTEGRHRGEGDEEEDEGGSLDALAGSVMPDHDVTCGVSQHNSSVTGGTYIDDNFQWQPSQRFVLHY